MFVVGFKFTWSIFSRVIVKIGTWARYARLSHGLSNTRQWFVGVTSTVPGCELCVRTNETNGKLWVATKQGVNCVHEPMKICECLRRCAPPTAIAINMGAKGAMVKQRQWLDERESYNQPPPSWRSGDTSGFHVWSARRQCDTTRQHWRAMAATSGSTWIVSQVYKFGKIEFGINHCMAELLSGHM